MIISYDVPLGSDGFRPSPHLLSPIFMKRTTLISDNSFFWCLLLFLSSFHLWCCINLNSFHELMFIHIWKEDVLISSGWKCFLSDQKRSFSSWTPFTIWIGWWCSLIINSLLASHSRTTKIFYSCFPETWDLIISADDCFIPVPSWCNFKSLPE